MRIQRTRLEAESLAERAIGATEAGRGAAWCMILGFLGILAGVAAWDAKASAADAGAGRGPRLAAWEPGARLCQAARGPGIRGAPGPGGVWAVNARVLEAIATVEDEIEQGSILTRALIPPVQEFMSGVLRLGNENAYAGIDGWLFYRPGVELVTGPGFLDPRRLHRIRRSGSEWRSPPQPDPVRAVVHFRDRLAARGIELIVLPAPTKASIHPGMFAPRASRAPPLQNPSFPAFLSRLDDAGILRFDPAPLLAEAEQSSGRAQYLRTDSHWTPDAVVRVARSLAGFIGRSVDLPPAPPANQRRATVEVSGRGDLAGMLRLAEGSPLYPPETVSLEQVLPGADGIWRPSLEADVLLLGDSFSNIYSYDAMGWGESAGLAEQLSFELGRAIDRIVRNDNGAFATRQALARELARGRDRLAGKKLVVWQFAARELMFGDWKEIDLTLGERPSSVFLGLNAGETCVVEGTVAAIGAVPQPGTVPYRDHIVAVHLVDVAGPACGQGDATEAYVFAWSMRDNAWTRAARLRPGDAVRLRVRPWADVAPEWDYVNRGEIDSEVLWLEEPLWGEMEP